MENTFEVGEYIEVKLIGRIVESLGDDKYIVNIHGEMVPIFASRMKSLEKEEEPKLWETE